MKNSFEPRPLAELLFRRKASLHFRRKEHFHESLCRDEFEGPPIWTSAPHFPIEKIIALWCCLLVLLLAGVAPPQPDYGVREGCEEAMGFMGP